MFLSLSTTQNHHLEPTVFCLLSLPPRVRDKSSLKEDGFLLSAGISDYCVCSSISERAWLCFCHAMFASAFVCMCVCGVCMFCADPLTPFLFVGEWFTCRSHRFLFHLLSLGCKTSTAFTYPPHLKITSTLFSPPFLLLCLHLP